MASLMADLLEASDDGKVADKAAVVGAEAAGADGEPKGDTPAAAGGEKPPAAAEKAPSKDAAAAGAETGGEAGAGGGDEDTKTEDGYVIVKAVAGGSSAAQAEKQPPADTTKEKTATVANTAVTEEKQTGAEGVTAPPPPSPGAESSGGAALTVADVLASPLEVIEAADSTAALTACFVAICEAIHSDALTLSKAELVTVSKKKKEACKGMWNPAVGKAFGSILKAFAGRAQVRSAADTPTVVVMTTSLTNAGTQKKQSRIFQLLKGETEGVREGGRKGAREREVGRGTGTEEDRYGEECRVVVELRECISHWSLWIHGSFPRLESPLKRR